MENATIKLDTNRRFNSEEEMIWETNPIPFEKMNEDDETKIKFKDVIGNNHLFYRNKLHSDIIKRDDGKYYYAKRIQFKDYKTGKTFYGNVGGLSSVLEITGFPFVDTTFVFGVEKRGFVGGKYQLELDNPKKDWEDIKQAIEGLGLFKIIRTKPLVHISETEGGLNISVLEGKLNYQQKRTIEELKKSNDFSTIGIICEENGRSGRTTRIVDKIIQDLFNNGFAYVNDHFYSNHVNFQNSKRIADIVYKRLKNEHNITPDNLFLYHDNDVMFIKFINNPKNQTRGYVMYNKTRDEHILFIATDKIKNVSEFSTEINKIRDDGYEVCDELGDLDVIIV